jgi:hypothetical protein
MRDIPDEAVPWISAAAATRSQVLRFGPHTALAACLFGVGWLAWFYLDGHARTVVQRESVQTAEIGQPAQKMAEELTAQKTDVGALGAAQGLSTKDVIDLGNTNPRLNAAKIEISGPIAEGSSKVLRPKPAEKLSKISERVDHIGLKIAALLAAAPVADRSVSAAPVAQKRARGGRGDAFDPSQHPNAPGVPRALGTIPSAAPTAQVANR